MLKQCVNSAATLLVHADPRCLAVAAALLDWLGRLLVRTEARSDSQSEGSNSTELMR